MYLNYKKVINMYLKCTFNQYKSKNYQVRGFKTLVEMQQNSCSKYSNRPLFGKNTYNTQWISYNQWDEQINIIRGILQNMDVNSGDKVSIISNNKVEWAVSAYATYSSGGVFVPMYQNQLYKDWKYILKDSNSKVLICTNKNTYNECKSLLSINNLKYLMYFNENEIEINFNKSINSDKNKSNNVILPQENDLATIIYTSGTTGNPKGVELTHKNLVSNIKNIQGSFRDFSKICNENDRSISFLPWAHCYGQTCELHSLISTGSSLFLSKGVDKLVEEIAEIKPTLLFSVPALFNRIYDRINSSLSNNIIKKKLFEDALSTSKKIKFNENYNKIDEFKYKFYEKIIFNKIKEKLGGNLKLALVGGAATPPEVINFFENINIPIIEGYGLTETSPIITLGTTEYPDRKIGSVGKPIPENIVKILNQDENGVGEICVSGPSVMNKYHNNKLETDNVMVIIDNLKYFKTGDMGYLDDEGRLFITGRLKEQYKLENGKFVVPTVIEDAIIMSPDIKQVMIHGENKQFNIALIVPNKENISKDLLDDKEKMRQHYIREIEFFSKKKNIKNYEIPKDVIILDDEFNIDNGLLTPKLSIKRNKVYQKYKNLIDN